MAKRGDGLPRGQYLVYAVDSSERPQRGRHIVENERDAFLRRASLERQQHGYGRGIDRGKPGEIDNAARRQEQMAGEGANQGCVVERKWANVSPPRTVIAC